MTTWWSWQVRRAAAARLLLGVLLAVVTTSSAIIAGALGYSAAAATTAARSALGYSSGSEVVVTTRLGDDGEGQDRAAREALTAGFAPAPIDIISSIVSEPRPVTVDGRRTQNPMVAIGGTWLGVDDGPGGLRLVEGSWPSPGSLECAMEVRAAAREDAHPGSVLLVDGVLITITGLWQEPAATPLGEVDGPTLVLDPHVVARFGSTPFLRWDVSPDPGRITEEQLPPLAAGAGAVGDLVRVADTTGRGVTVKGDLAPVAEAAARESGTARAVQAVPMALLLLACAVCAAQVLRLLASARLSQEHLLAARGGGTARMVTMDLLEGCAVAVAGSTVGGLLAASALQFVPPGSHQVVAVSTGVLLTLAIVSCLLLATAALQYRRDPAISVAGGTRARAVAGVSAAVVAGVAAATSGWRLVSRDAVVNGSPGAPEPDVLAAAAPALMLAVSAVVALLVLAPVTRIAARLTRRMTSVVWPLATAHVSRALFVNAVSVVLAVMAAGAATLAAITSGSMAHHEQGLTLLTRGADLRVSTDPVPGREPPSITFDPDGVRGVAASAPVWIDGSATLGDATVSTVAMPSDRLAEVSLTPEVFLPPPATLELPPATGAAPLAVPAGTQTLALDVAATLSLDPWQEATLQIQPEFARRALGDVSRTGQLLEAYRMPVTVGVSLRLRDPATGEGGVAAAATVVVPGPDVSWASDFSDITSAPSTGSVRVEIPLDPTRDVVIDGVEITSQTDSSQGRTLDVAVHAAADSADLFGEDTAGWGSDDAVPADRAAPYLDALATAGRPDVRLEYGRNSDFLDVASNEPFVPLIADTTGSSWHIRDASGLLTGLVLGPGVPFAGQDPLQTMAGVKRPPTPRVPLAVTRDGTTTGALAVGDRIELITHQRFVPATVVALIDAVPGTTAPDSVLMDSRALGSVLGWLHDDVPIPDEVWMAVDAPSEAVTKAVLALPGAGAVITPPEGAGQGASRALNRGLLVAALGTLFLALVGIVAASAMQFAARRPEVKILRTLGFSAGAQGASRAAETLMVLVPAVALGALSGFLTALLSIHPLVTSIFRGQVRLPVQIRWDPTLTALFGGLLIVTIAGVAGLSSWVVSGQARASAARQERR